MLKKILPSLLVAAGLLVSAAIGRAQSATQATNVERFTDLGGGQVRREIGTLSNTGVFTRLSSSGNSLAITQISQATLNAVDNRFVMSVVFYNAFAALSGFTTNFRRSAEVYDIAGGDFCIITTGNATPPPPPQPPADTSIKPINVSTLTLCPAGGLVTVGFVLEGADSQQVLIRAIGPGLAPFGVTGALANPRLTVNKGATIIKANDDWSAASVEATALSAAFTAAGAFGIANGSRDSAALLTLDAGAYTAQAASVDAAASGLVIIEVYVLKK